jgi:hypothetical protein
LTQYNNHYIYLKTLRNKALQITVLKQDLFSNTSQLTHIVDHAIFKKPDYKDKKDQKLLVQPIVG